MDKTMEESFAEMWQEWVENLTAFDEQLEIERGGETQVRGGLDELFP